MRIHRVLVAAAVVVASMGTGAASAGGVEYWDWEAAYAPGEVVDEKVNLWLRGRWGAAVRAGHRFHAYLVPRAGYDLRVPRLPRTAQRLARIDIAPLGNSVYEFHLSFVVPPVEPGTYTVVQCGGGCREEPAGLMETPMQIVTSSAAAEAIRFGARRDESLQRQVFTLASTLRGRTIARRARRALAPTLEELKADLASQTETIARLRAGDRTRSNDVLLEAILSVLALAGVLSAVMTFLVRRRTSAPRADMQG